MSVFDTGFRQGWQQREAFDEAERARLAELNKPFRGNPPELMAPVRCRVLRPFCVAGQRVEIGAYVDLPKYDADSLRATGRVEIVVARRDAGN